MSTIKAETWQNPDGSTNYKCRAFVNFNGTGTVAIRASGNVSSITDNGIDGNTVNFTTAMTDDKYAVGILSSDFSIAGQSNEIGIVSMSTTSVQFKNLGSGSQSVDREFNKLTIFR